MKNRWLKMARQLKEITVFRFCCERTTSYVCHVRVRHGAGHRPLHLDRY